MPELKYTLSPGLWELLHRHAQQNHQPIAHVVTQALAQYFGAPHHTLYQVSTASALVEGIKCNFVPLIWVDGSYNMVAFQEVAKYGRSSGVDLGPVDVVKYAEAFGAKGLRIDAPDQILPALKKALRFQGPVVIAIPVDYRDNLKGKVDQPHIGEALCR